MKKFRPYKAGFIVIYVLSVLCISDALITLVRQARGTANEYLQSFSLFSYLIAVLAVLYVKMYAATRIELDGKSMRIVCPFYIKPAAGTKRAMFVYRQGENDIKLVDKKFALADLLKYGYVEDMGYSTLDKSNAGPKNKLFPVHEMALVMKDGKRYHVNAGFYSPKQLKEIVDQLVSVTGVHPTGALAREAGVEPAPEVPAE